MKKITYSALFLALTITLSMVYAVDEAATTATDPTPAAEEAGFNVQKSYDWLVSKGSNGNYGGDISTSALAGLALSEVGYDQSAKLVANWILADKDPKDCVPKGECNTKETALAMMLFKSLSMSEADSFQIWLEENQVPLTAQGKWILEISTQATGECEISYDLRNKTFKDKIAVDKGKFPSCSNSNFLDMESCFKSGLLKSEAGMKFVVDCSSLGEAPIITLLYSKDNTFYIISTTFGSVAEVTVTNGCYSKTAKGTCNKESSLYAAWALSKVGSPQNINLYLLENYDSTSVLDNSLVYSSFMTKDTRYLEAIKSRQSATDGSFNRDFFQTALALIALKDSSTYTEKVDKAIKWLESKQGTEGSWGQNVRDTAMILYAAYGSAVLKPETVKEATSTDEAAICNKDYVCDSDETADGCTDCADKKDDNNPVCNSDNVCDDLDGETEENCVDCTCGDAICDSSEDSDSCLEDCEEADTGATSNCGDGTCDGSEEDSDSCSEDCKQADTGMGFGTIMIIGLVVILALAGIFLAYKKFSQPPAKPKTASPFSQGTGYTFKRAQPPAQPPQQPSRIAARPSQLQSSLNEARKLLRK